ncbi:hypothetical protein N186_08040 [Thermofilum adornatum]|uniref:Uncharacterized protein n=1 Tax=Thermofilum adornatum TaxID=1365176 RepID=S5ZMX0_9CREN|nr:hypothetical protein N186_08040 [Thermofilum adornatum]
MLGVLPVGVWCVFFFLEARGSAAVSIERGLRGGSLTLFRHSMYRPMLYVDVRDVARAFRAYAVRVLDGRVEKEGGSLRRVLNLFYPEPYTVLEIAEMVRDVIREVTGGALEPRIEVVDQGLPSLFGPGDKYRFRLDVSGTLGFLGLGRLISPRESIEYIVRRRLGKETG